MSSANAYAIEVQGNSAGIVVASANPEDYTNRGRIITPLKDRFGAEVRTHYPVELDDEIAVMTAQEDLVEVVHTLRQVVCVKG